MLASSPPCNAGSRTYAQAGLAHYTTRVDQLKEMNDTASEMVDIGLHYVATTEPTSAQPKDSDVDGIPDFVEDGNGNGQWDEGIETKINTAYTEAGVHDTLNIIYDNIDLSGSGLSGAVKKALGLSPLSTFNPLVLTPAGAGANPNTFTFAVAALSYDQLNSVGSLELFADGHPVTFLRNDRQGDGSCLLTWDGTFEGAGQRFFQLGIHLNGQTKRGGMGFLAVADANLTASTYPYPLRLGTYEWENTDPYDRVASVVIPQSWLDTVTSWQRFCSAIANPYFEVLWCIGDSMTDSYNAAKSLTTLSVLTDIESEPDFGANVLRFLLSLDVPDLVRDDSQDKGLSVFHYIIVCHMAGLDSALNTLDQASLQRLFRLAVWDANTCISSSDDLVATAPVRLMYAVYGRLSPPPAGLTLSPLTSEQSANLDRGDLPPELVPVVASAKATLGLTSRP